MVQSLITGKSRGITRLIFLSAILAIYITVTSLKHAMDDVAPSNPHVHHHRHLLHVKDPPVGTDLQRPNYARWLGLFREKDDGNRSEIIEQCFLPAPTNSTLFPKDLFTDDELADGWVALYAVGILYMFYALALICDHYFVPCIGVFIEKWDVSPDVAGATLMAAAESAPEIFTNFIGVFIAKTDVGIGTIVGSAVFNVLFVMAACSFASATVLNLTPWPLIRDTVFYAVSLALLAVFFIDNEVEWWQSLILLLWYVIYCSFMTINQRVEALVTRLLPCINKTGKAKGNEVSPAVEADHDLEISGPSAGESQSGESTATNSNTVGTATADGGDAAKAKAESEADAGEEVDYASVLWQGPTGSPLNKLVWLVSFPLLLIMWASLPDPNKPSQRRYYALTFLISIVWISVGTYLMVWWAATTGRIAGIPDSIMGLTFLAAGTSVPDLMSSILVARQGHGDMAISSSIGSNIFDVTVALPLPWIIYSAVEGTPMPVSSLGLACNVGMLFAMLMLLFVSLVVFRWRMSKPLGAVMLVLHIVFILFSLGLSYCIIECPT